MKLNGRLALIVFSIFFLENEVLKENEKNGGLKKLVELLQLPNYRVDIRSCQEKPNFSALAVDIHIYLPIFFQNEIIPHF